MIWLIKCSVFLECDILYTYSWTYWRRGLLITLLWDLESQGARQVSWEFHCQRLRNLRYVCFKFYFYPILLIYLFFFPFSLSLSQNCFSLSEIKMQPRKDAHLIGNQGCLMPWYLLFPPNNHMDEYDVGEFEGDLEG